MLDAFADRVDRRVGGAHRVVDDDAAIDLAARRPWPASMLGRMPTAITTRSAGSSRPSSSRTPSTRSLAEDRLGLAFGEQVQAAAARARVCSRLPATRIELALHQPSASDARRSPPCRASSGRWPLPARAGRRRSPRRACRAPQASIICSTSAMSRKVTDARQIDAGQRQHDRPRAGREQQAVVGLDAAALRR